MKKRLVLAAVAVACALALSASSASAVTVSPGGSTTASFPSGGMTFQTPFITTLCPVVLVGGIGTAGSGSITGAVVNSGSPCLGASFIYHDLPWPLVVSYVSSTEYTIQITRVSFTMSIGGTRCGYAGTITLPVTNGTRAIGPPSGTLSGACGPMIVGGTGGNLSPVHTVTP